MMITILDGGIHSVIQDLGRTGYQTYGVIRSGAMDAIALRIANLLVGNTEAEAGIEVTFGKTACLFHDERLIAITGGQLNAKLNGHELMLNRPYLVRNGDILRFKTATVGCRAYIAISGGFKLKKVLNSLSTYEKARFGGWHGRALKRLDEIPLNGLALKQQQILTNWKRAKWFVNCRDFYSFGNEIIPIHVLPGLDIDLFQSESRRNFEDTIYTISSRSNRMGYHLEGSATLHLTKQQEILSEAVTFGTVQVPPSGKPMILMADAQTVGGYPKLAQVLKSDLSRLAQALPGQKIQFKFVDLKEAEHRLFSDEIIMQQIRFGVQQKFKERPPS